MKIQPVVLCGGSGTRLWPASRKSLPKQFIKIFDGKSLFDLTLERVKSLKNFQDPIIVTSKHHGFLVKESLKKYSLNGSILLEPLGKNTTAAIYLAALHSNQNDNLLILASDQLIPDNKYFSDSVSVVNSKHQKSNWVTFGVKPTYASTSYGYIKFEKNVNKEEHLFKVERFIEKPNPYNAELMINQKNYLWNSSIFFGNTEMIINSIKKHAPEVAKYCKKVTNDTIKSVNKSEINFEYNLFKKIPSISIDYSVMEKAQNIMVYPYDGEWSDLGSWEALSKFERYNLKSEKIIEINSKNNYIRNDKRIVATINTEDLIIIDNDNATLIAKKGSSEQIKEVINELRSRGLSEGVEHSFEIRPWGKFENLLESKICKVKKIEVNPHQRLSLQYHNHRSEHWLIVEGEATIYLDGEIKNLVKGNSIDIAKKAHHYVENKTDFPLVIIETQIGEYFGEDDIIRLDDPYNR